MSVWSDGVKMRKKGGEERRGGFIEKRTNTHAFDKPARVIYRMEPWWWSFQDWTIIATYSVRCTEDKYY